MPPWQWRGGLIGWSSSGSMDVYSYEREVYTETGQLQEGP